MKMPLKSKETPRWALPREQAAVIRASVTRATGLKIDLDRLDRSEQYELAELVRRIGADAEPGVHRSDPRFLGDRDRARYEQLVELGADRRGHFARARADAADAVKLRELVERANRPKPQRRVEELETTILPPEIYGALRNAHGLAAPDLLVLTLVLISLQAGPLTPHARLENETLVLSGGAQPWAGLDPDDVVRGADRALRWLDEAGWLTVVTSGAETRIGYGRLLRAAFARRAAA